MLNEVALFCVKPGIEQTSIVTCVHSQTHTSHSHKSNVLHCLAFSYFVTLTWRFDATSWYVVAFMLFAFMNRYCVTVCLTVLSEFVQSMRVLGNT